MRPLKERIDKLTEVQAKEALLNIARQHYDVVAIAVTGMAKKNNGS